MRHFILITYDISDDRRLRKMYQLLRGYGDHIQDSVFLCQLSEKDKFVLMEKMKDIIHSKEDQTIIIQLGSVEGSKKTDPLKWKVLGKPVIVSDHSVMIY